MRRWQGKAWRVIAGSLAVAVAALARAAAAPPLPDGAAAPLPPPRPDAPAPSRSADADAQDAACQDRLARLGVRFETRPPLQEGFCGAPGPILLQSLPDGLAVPAGVVTTCPLAEALARWSLDVLGPQAQRRFGEAPSRLLIGTSYQCREQRSGAKPSEHAFANAVDVAGFTIGRERAVPVATHPDGSPEADFLAAARQAACAYFTTVLGPGQEGHDEHLHLDLRQRNGGFRICQ
jgi:hypothetical protein